MNRSDASQQCLLAACLFGCLCMGSTSALACASGKDRSALQVRVLQSDLMVAALSCGDRNRYNSFATRFRNELVSRGKDLRAYFHRTYGKEGESRLNQFVTQLANSASRRSLTTPTSYCGDATRLFNDVLMLEPTELVGFVAQHPHADSHGVEPCTQQASTQ